MATYFNPGNESFRKDIRSKIYVDKTGLLEILNDMLFTNTNCIALSHARRFGKSQAAYRTQKVREDAAYYRQLLTQSESDYLQAMQTYSDYTDSHSNSMRQSQKSESERLRNELEIKLSAYNLIKTQLTAAEAKVQERTPAFTTVKSATVPQPSGRTQTHDFRFGYAGFIHRHCCRISVD